MAIRRDDPPAASEQFQCVPPFARCEVDGEAPSEALAGKCLECRDQRFAWRLSRDGPEVAGLVLYLRVVLRPHGRYVGL